MSASKREPSAAERRVREVLEAELAAAGVRLPQGRVRSLARRLVAVAVPERPFVWREPAVKPASAEGARLVARWLEAQCEGGWPAPGGGLGGPVAAVPGQPRASLSPPERPRSV